MIKPPKVGKIQTYDQQEQIDLCLECTKTRAECNYCEIHDKRNKNIRRKPLDMAAIIKARSEGMTMQQIADMMGVSRSTISKRLRGRA